MRSSRRVLYGLTLAALLVRLAIWPWFDRIEPQIYDEADYDEIAANLAERGEFAIDGEVTTKRPPLYPAMVSLVYRLAGVGNYQAVRLLQILLNLAIVPLVFALGRRLYDERTGVVAAALAVFYPSLWGHGYLLLTEVLFTVLLIAGTLALLEATSERGPGSTHRAPASRLEAVSPESAARPRWAPLVAAGVAFGLGTLTRTTLLFYPPFFAIALFARWRAPSPRRIAAVAVFCLAFAMTVAPWIARNTRLRGRLASVDSLSNSTAARFSPLRHLVEAGVVERSQARGRHRQAERPSRERADVADGAAPRSGEATESAPRRMERPHEPGGRIARVLSDAAWDTLLFWRIDRELAGAAARGWLGPLPRPVVIGLALGIAGYYVALMLAGAAGLVLRPPPDRLQLALVLSVFVVLTAVHALSFGHSRYHIPLMPLVALFAARLWVGRREPVARGRLAAAVAVAALLIGSWTATFVRFDLRDVQRRLVAPAAEER